MEIILKSKNYKKIASSLVLFIVIISIFSIIIPVSRSDKIYNARCWFDLEWSDIETQKPVVPRDEIKRFNLTVKFEIRTGETYGKGAVDAYIAAERGHPLIELEVIDSSHWCDAVMERPTIATNFTWSTEVKTAVFITINENAPAYGEGFIKIHAYANNLGLIEGYSNNFTLPFTPAYKPIVDAKLLNLNSKKISPNDEAVFPIELENMGNARTKVLLEVNELPEGWTATVTDYVILAEQEGSKETAYLSVIPPSGLGYHDEEISITVKMTPIMAENPEEVGNSFYANFIVESRGFSVNGIEQYIFYIIIIGVILLIILLIYKRVNKKNLEN